MHNGVRRSEMKLINVSTLQIEEFLDQKTPKYAILSHTWGNEEVTYQDMQPGKTQSKKGWLKIRSYCDLVKRDGLEYAWIDTCCIDKSSSSELSESINSMFAYYQEAAVCHAYLVDVESCTDLEAFRQSRWFTRGWTLQELLAPSCMLFLNYSWETIGSKAQLAYVISTASGISLDHLVDFNEACVAQKMFWASTRETTRVEDQAYCLLGLFGINLPLLYGERQNAFLRLQLEIIRVSQDDSIFAWTKPSNLERSNAILEYKHENMLAVDPSQFVERSVTFRVAGETANHFEATNRGLKGDFMVSKQSPKRVWIELNARNSNGHKFVLACADWSLDEGVLECLECFPVGPSETHVSNKGAAWARETLLIGQPLTGQSLIQHHRTYLRLSLYCLEEEVKRATSQSMTPENIEQRCLKSYQKEEITSSTSAIFRLGFDGRKRHFEVGVGLLGFWPTIWLSVFNDDLPFSATDHITPKVHHFTGGIEFVLAKPKRLGLPVAAVYCGSGGTTGVFANLQKCSKAPSEDAFDVSFRANMDRQEALKILGPPDHTRNQGARDLAWWFWKLPQLKDEEVEDPGEAVPILFELKLGQKVRQDYWSWEHEMRVEGT